MMVNQIAAVLGVLGTPAWLAPVLVRIRGRIPSRLWTFLAAIICLVPLSAPYWLVGIRSLRIVMVTAILAGIIMLKAIDWLAAPRDGGDRVRVWLALTFWPALEIEDVAVPIEHASERRKRLIERTAIGFVSLISGLALAAAGASLRLPDRSVWIDSSFKCLEIYLIAGGGNHLMVAAFSAAGFRVTDGFRYPFLAHSILDFWSRYNVWIHRWLKKHIFEPIGRRKRRPVTGILAVFAASGLLHESLMVPVAPDLIGWQCAFFVSHGVGAIAGIRLGRSYRAIFGRGVPRALAISATLVFVLATAPIFIHCMDRVIDLHRDIGEWSIRHLGNVSPQAEAPGPASG